MFHYRFKFTKCKPVAGLASMVHFICICVHNPSLWDINVIFLRYSYFARLHNLFCRLIVLLSLELLLCRSDSSRNVYLPTYSVVSLRMGGRFLKANGIDASAFFLILESKRINSLMMFSRQYREGMAMKR